MEVKEINNKEVWENFLINRKEKTFLVSWNWAEFQKKEGNKIWRLGIYDSEQLLGVALIIKIKAKRGTFLFIPHGPIISGGNREVFKCLLKKIKEIAKKTKASFIRIASIWERNEKNIKIFKDFKFREAPIHMHPEITWELNISLPKDELLTNMRKTTRYLIRRAEKNNDIEILKSSDINDLEKFRDIYQETVKRHHFTPFSLKYLENQFSSFSKDNQILILLGKYENQVVSSSIIVFWQNIGFYHHGASLSDNKASVSYLMQWEAIKEAQKRGCKTYNFWGIADEKETNFPTEGEKIKKKHPWWGLTLFKMGFGGYKKKYVKTQDLVLSYKYYFNYIIEKIRKIKRGL